MTDRCFDQNRRDDTDSGCLPAVLWEVEMVQATIRRFGAIRALVLVGLLGIELIASAAVPAVGELKYLDSHRQHDQRSHPPYRHAPCER